MSLKRPETKETEEQKSGAVSVKQGRDARQLTRLFFFPLTFLYLELLFHLYMGLELRYAPIYLLFGLSAGFLLSAGVNLLPRKAERIVTPVLAGVLALVYDVELVCRNILQSYYPLSTLGTAAENHLSDYSSVIVSTVGSKLPILLCFFLPLVVSLVLELRWKAPAEEKKPDWRMGLVLLAGVLVFHLLGLGVVHLDWKSDLPPKQLYHMDSNMDDQVEQLGLITMLRLDIKHQFVPAESGGGEDFEGFESLEGLAPLPTLAPAPTPSPTPAPTAEPTEAPEETDTPEPTPTPVPTPEPTPEIDRSPNVMDVDLEKVAANTNNDSIRWLAEYFNSLPGTRKNEYTGMFEGYNVIEVVVEGFSGYAIDPELTPTLYKLTHEGFHFKNFYTALHFTSTSNGECQTILGLYPKAGNPISMKRTGELGTNCYFSLPQQLLRQGYQVQGYHANSNMYGRYNSHTNLGYEWKQGGSGFPLEMRDGQALWPQKDTYLIEASIDDYINSDKPFHTYYLTIAGHMPYSNNRIVAPYRDIVRQLPYTETTQNYVATAMEIDRALELLIQKLDEAGKLDKTLLVVTPDHIPYFDVATLQELSGQKFGNDLGDFQYLREGDINFEVYHSALILWSASMEEPVEVDKVCCQVDILPTVSNLLGLDYDSRMLAGSDILSDSEGLVVFSSRCWQSDRGFYNRFDGTFTPAPGVEMTPEEQDAYVSTMKKLVGYKLDSTPKIIENDFYNVVFGDKQTR